MVRLLIYGYTTGVRSSRAIEKRCVDDVPFRWLACGAAPDYRSVARFRKRHLSALAQLFLQALKLCQAAGMVSLGRVALDGTKVRANASKRKAMSYARLTEKEKVLAEEVSALLAEAQRIDDTEDEKFGKDRRGDELPAELARRETRLVKLREAKQALEAQAREAAAEHAAELARRKGAEDDTVAERAAQAQAAAVPKLKSQRGTGTTITLRAGKTDEDRAIELLPEDSPVLAQIRAEEAEREAKQAKDTEEKAAREAAEQAEDAAQRAEDQAERAAAILAYVNSVDPILRLAQSDLRQIQIVGQEVRSEASRVLCRLLAMEDGDMPKKYDPEIKARAVRMVHDHLPTYGSVTATAAAVGPQLGISENTLRRWVNQADVDAGRREGVPTDVQAELARLTAENKRLRETNEILRRASIFFAGELDPRAR